MRHAFPLAAMLLLAGPAAAQTVDAAGADQLATDLKRYLSDAAFSKGIVAVSVDDDAYRIAFDFKALAGLLPKEVGAKVDFQPYALRVKPRGDGTWDVSGALAPNGSFEANTPEGPMKMTIGIADGRIEGVYDPAIAAFLSASGSHGALTVVSNNPVQTTDVKVDGGKFTYTGAPAANGAADFAMTQEQTGFVEDVQLDDKASGMKFAFAVRAPKVTTTANAKAIRSRAMLDLLAFGVAHADEEKVKANEAELKAKLLAILPLWDRMEGSYAFDDMAVDTPVGPVSAKRLEAQVGMDGVAAATSISYGFKLTGLNAPWAIVAPWVAKIAPTDIELNFAGSNMDLDALLRGVIQATDLKSEQPVSDEIGRKLGEDFLAKGPKFGIGKSVIKNADTQFAFSGDFTVKGDKPDMTLTIDATGYDKLVEALQQAAAADPTAQQAFPALLAAKGFAKTMPDGSLQWVVNAKPDGSVFINGGMMKGPDPIPSPEPLPDPSAPAPQ